MKKNRFLYTASSWLTKKNNINTFFNVHTCANIFMNSERAINSISNGIYKNIHLWSNLIKKNILVFDCFRHFSLFLGRTCIQACKKIWKECPNGLKIWDYTILIWGTRKKEHIVPPFFIKYPNLRKNDSFFKIYYSKKQKIFD